MDEYEQRAAQYQRLLIAGAVDELKKVEAAVMKEWPVSDPTMFQARVDNVVRLLCRPRATG